MKEHPAAERLAQLVYERLREHRGLQSEATERARCGRNYWREAAQGGHLSATALYHAAEVLQTPAWMLVRLAMEGESNQLGDENAG